MKKKGILRGLPAIMLVLAITIAGCDDSSTNTNGNFVAVTDIINVTNTISIGSPFLLEGTVEPNNAANGNIVWSIKDAYNTGAEINGNSLTVTGFGSDWGKVTVTATIPNGISNGNDFTKDIDIKINPYNRATNTLHFIAVKGPAYSSRSTQGGIKFHDFYQGTIEKETKYKVTITGTLDRDIDNGRFSMFIAVNEPVNNNFVYVNWNYPGLECTSGPISHEFIIQTNSANEIDLYPELAQLDLYFGFSNDPNGVSDSDVGKVAAKITDFTITIEKVYEQVYFIEFIEGEITITPFTGSGDISFENRLKNNYEQGYGRIIGTITNGILDFTLPDTFYDDELYSGVVNGPANILLLYLRYNDYILRLAKLEINNNKVVDMIYSTEDNLVTYDFPSIEFNQGWNIFELTISDVGIINEERFSGNLEDLYQLGYRWYIITDSGGESGGGGFEEGGGGGEEEVEEEEE